MAVIWDINPHTLIRSHDACHLHGQGGAAGDDSPRPNVLRHGPGNGKWIDAGMMVKPPIFIVDKRLKVEGGDLFCGGGIAPDSHFVGEGP